MKIESGDYTLEWMYRNLSPEEITLTNYIAINWCNEKRSKTLKVRSLRICRKNFTRSQQPI